MSNDEMTPQMLAVFDQRHVEMREVLNRMCQMAYTLGRANRNATDADLVIAGMGAIEKTNFPHYALIGLLATAVVELARERGM
jgi:hypothetical protein